MKPEARFEANNNCSSDVEKARAKAFYRKISLVLVFTMLWKKQYLDHLIARFYSWLLTKWWFKHDSFEPVVATGAFASWHWLWYFIEIYGGERAKKYLINSAQRPDWHDWENKRSIHRAAALAYLLPLMTFDAIYPRRRLPLKAPTLSGILAGVVSALWLYDLIFYPIHLAMHKIPWLSKYHRTHHSSSPLIATEVLNHSFIDGSLQVTANILTLNLLRLHPMTRAAYNIIVTYMLSEIHSGYDFPWMLHNLVPYGILGGSPRHEKHHSTGHHNFHQFFTYIDDFLGYGSDYNDKL